MREYYISTDVETDGPIPGENSMLSFGSAAFDSDGHLVSTFSRNLHQLTDAKEDPITMEWWYSSKNRDAWEAHRRNLKEPLPAMIDYVRWLKDFSGKPVFVGYPAGFDFTFIYWYLIKFAKESPFSFSAIDIKTYAMALLDKNYRDITKRIMPREWFGPSSHTHVALDDAIEQGELFMNMFKFRRASTLITHDQGKEADDE